HNVLSSRCYTIARPFQDLCFPPSLKEAASATSANPKADAQSLADDPRFQRVLQDPEIQQELRAKDFVKLMSNPKMMELTRELISDPAALKKVMGIYNSSAQALKQ